MVLKLKTPNVANGGKTDDPNWVVIQHGVRVYYFEPTCVFGVSIHVVNTQKHVLSTIQADNCHK